MNDVVLAALACPVCGAPLHRAPGALRCVRAGHSFDVARHGYAHLGTGRRLPDGDSATMVAARDEFLVAGHYTVLAEAIADALPPEPRLIVDAGAGTGYYLATALSARPGAAGLAMDVSKPALRRAARCHPRASAVLADTWGRLPLAGGSADVLLNVFAPRNGDEFARVLSPEGVLVVATPEPEHLARLRDRLGLLAIDPVKEERLAATLRGFQVVSQRTVRWPRRLSHVEVGTLVAMSPNARHADPVELAERVAALPPMVEIEAAVRIGVYRTA